MAGTLSLWLRAVRGFRAEATIIAQRLEGFWLVEALSARRGEGLAGKSGNLRKITYFSVFFVQFVKKSVFFVHFLFSANLWGVLSGAEKGRAKKGPFAAGARARKRS